MLTPADRPGIKEHVERGGAGLQPRPKKRRQNADPEKGTYSDPSFGGARGEMHSNSWVNKLSRKL